ncbi:hypothetical protein EVAR_25199_1 [Eumeta japonica]|uniref:Uncharacterized protein n=1 Tax=Eumeta variegata TaxID=151549 RepID=A0A4C1WJ31_EUMVA|nr:hypothetical protein EVAR_25199_1 [Eumeta japonica]
MRAVLTCGRRSINVRRAAVGCVRDLTRMDRTAVSDASRNWAAGDVRSRVCSRPPPSSITAPHVGCPLHLPVVRICDDARALAGGSAAIPAKETITKHPRTRIDPGLEEVKKKKKKMNPE